MRYLDKVVDRCILWFRAIGARQTSAERINTARRLQMLCPNMAKATVAALRNDRDEYDFGDPYKHVAKEFKPSAFSGSEVIAAYTSKLVLLEHLRLHGITDVTELPYDQLEIVYPLRLTFLVEQAVRISSRHIRGTEKFYSEKMEELNGTMNELCLYSTSEID